MSTLTFNIIKQVCVELGAGYMKFHHTGFVDKETPEDGTDKGYKIDDAWLEKDIGDGGVTVGASLVFNIINKE